MAKKHTPTTPAICPVCGKLVIGGWHLDGVSGGCEVYSLRDHTCGPVVEQNPVRLLDKFSTTDNGTTFWPEDPEDTHAFCVAMAAKDGVDEATYNAIDTSDMERIEAEANRLYEESEAERLQREDQCGRGWDRSKYPMGQDPDALWTNRGR